MPHPETPDASGIEAAAVAELLAAELREIIGVAGRAHLDALVDLLKAALQEADRLAEEGRRRSSAH